LAKKLLQRIGEKKLWQMLTCIVNRQSSINSKMKPNKSIPNIDEHNKTNSVFFRICLVPRASGVFLMMVRCTVESMIWIYKQTITWKWTGPLKILQYQYPYLNPYTKQIKAYFMLQRAPHITKNGKLVKKVGELLWYAKFAKVFSPLKFFTVW